MGKQDSNEDQKKKKKKIKEKPSCMHGVIITVYVESKSTVRSQQKSNPMKKIKANPYDQNHQTARTQQGYDRRAKLLAYAKELRAAGNQELRSPRKSTRLKPKISQRTNWRRKYERLASEENEEIDDGCCINNNRKKKTTGRSISHFCRKLKRMFKELSCGCWHCNKGVKET